MPPTRPPDDLSGANLPFPENPEGGSASHTEPQGSGSLNSYSTSSGPEQPGPQLVKQSDTPRSPSPVAIWVDRFALVIKVVIYIEIGMVLAILPWIRVWTDNGLILSFPHARAFLQQNFVRGLVTGIGLVDIWIGIWEAVHYRDRK